MYLSHNKNLIVNVISTSKIEVAGQGIKKSGKSEKIRIGRRMPTELLKPSDYQPKEHKELRVAVIVNWNDNCGISTYAKYLVDAMIPQVKALKIFSEITGTPHEGYDVDECWERGKCLIPMIKKVKEYGADFVIVQHEYGIFPNAFYFSQLCQYLRDIPYVIVMHSVYEHLDKLVYSEAAKNILVHTDNQKTVLKKLGNGSNIYVVPHGCISYPDTSELWNIHQNPYTIVSFGFLFPYKNIPRTLKAIKLLKDTDPKFKNIFFTYLSSENSHNANANQSYYDEIVKMVADMGLEENVSIIKKYQTEQMLCLYLRLNKLAVFPYANNPNNEVFSASGAIRISIANKIPVIASESHLFDDMSGILPRPISVEELAATIDKVFSDENYKNSIVNAASKYVQDNSWSSCATKYLNVYNQLVSNQ